MTAFIPCLFLVMLGAPPTPSRTPTPAPTPPATRLLVLEAGPAVFTGPAQWQTIYTISESAEATWEAGGHRGVFDANERRRFGAAYDAALAAVARSGGIHHQQFHCRAVPTGTMRLTIGGRSVEWVVPCGDGPIAEVKTLLQLARAFVGDSAMRYTWIGRPDTDEANARVIVIQGGRWMASGPDGRRDGVVSPEQLATLHALARAAAFTLQTGAPGTCTKPTQPTRQEVTAGPYGELAWALRCTDLLDAGSAALIAYMQAITKG